MEDSLEVLWDHLLSRRAEWIRRAFRTLSADEKRAVLIHLQRMRDEPGWHAEQRFSAEIALQALENFTPDL